MNSFAAPGTVPPSLTDPGLATLWRAVRRRVDRDGRSMARTIQMPAVEPRCLLALTTLLGRSPSQRLDLAALEAGLRHSGVGDELNTALTRLGYPSDETTVEGREARERTKRAHAALAEGIGNWPEAWATEWSEELRQSGLVGGLDAGEVAALLDDVRRLLDFASNDADGRRTRAEAAAQLFGSAHALDGGTKRAAAVERALRRVVEPSVPQLEGRALWDAAGLVADSVSAPVLTWGLRPLGSSALAALLHCAADAGQPLHVSLSMLRAHTVDVPSGVPILVVENPSVIETAIGKATPIGLVCTNGNPSTAVTVLVEQLSRCGAALSYHGDFDAAGIAICRRMHERGCDPWMMGAQDYLSAARHAQDEGIGLPRDARACGPTPWAPELEAEFTARRSIVHEELVVDELLASFGAHVAACL